MSPISKSVFQDDLKQAEQEIPQTICFRGKEIPAIVNFEQDSRINSITGHMEDIEGRIIVRTNHPIFDDRTMKMGDTFQYKGRNFRIGPLDPHPADAAIHAQFMHDR